MSRLLRGLIVGIVALLTVVLCALWLLLGTTQGSQWLVTQAVTFVPGELRIEAQGGTVVTGLTAERVVYRNEEFTVELTDISLDVRLSALLDKRIAIERLTVAALSSDELHLTDIDLGAAIELSEAFPLTASLRWAGGGGQISRQISGTGDFSGDLVNLEFNHHIALPAVIDVSGVVRAVLTQPSINAMASFSELPLVIGDDQFVIRDGTLILSGTAETLTIERAEAMAFGGHIGATGTLKSKAGPMVALKIIGENLNPATVRPDLDGRLGFTLRVDALSATDIDVVLDHMSGEFLGTHVNGSGSARLHEGLVERVDLDLRSGRNQLELSAVSAPDFSGEWRLDTPELATLWPGLEGALEGTGRFSGTLEEPVAVIRLDGTQFRFGEFSLERIHVDGDVAANGELDWTAQVNNARSGELSLGQLQASVRGKLADHRLAARVSGGMVGAQIEARGAWDGEQLATTIESAVIDGGAAGAWTLRDAVQLEWAPDHGSIGQHCWMNRRPGLAPAELCTGGISMNDDRWIAAATLRHFPLATFEPWLPEDVRISGEADADLSIDWGQSPAPYANVSWRQEEMRLSFPLDDMSGTDDEVATTLRDIQFTLAANENVATIEGHATGDYGLTLLASASLDDPLDQGGRLAGKVDAKIPDIGAFRPLIDRFMLTSSIGGELDVSAGISGTFATPVIEGRADLRGGSAGIVVAGIELADANLSIIGHQDGTVQLDGSVRSGEGLVRLDGQIDWSAERGVISNLRLTGNDFEALRLPDQRVVISPDVKLSLDDDNIVLTGRILVPEARFVIQELGRSAVATSADVVVHDELQPVQQRERMRQLVGSLDLQLGDDVTFSGFEIETRLAGGLQLNATAAAPLTAEGSLQLVDGHYGGFGKNKALTIEQGSLGFHGPLDDPVLDVRASRQVRYEGRSIRAGVILSGQISRQLDFLFFSDPIYSESDVISFLLVDRPATTTEGVDSTAISSAALAMGMRSLLPNAGDGSGLGLDEVGLQGVGSEDTEVVAGKRFGDDLYVRYRFGLFSRIGTLLVRYDIGRGFSIEAGSGEQQTLDLLYSIDR